MKGSKEMNILQKLFNELTNLTPNSSTQFSSQTSDVINSNNKDSNDKNSIKNKIKLYDFMVFVLGSELENRDEPFSETMLYNLYNGKEKLSTDNLQKLANSTDWGFSRFNRITRPSKRIQFTYITETYATSEAFSNHIKEVVFEHFFQTTTPEYKLLPTAIPQTCTNYIPWESMESEIKKTICTDSHPLIFISGMPGSGKTQLLRSICSSISKKEIYYYDFDPCIPLKAGFSNITYDSNADITWEKLAKHLNNDYLDALLIIDKPDLKKDDFEFIRNELCKLNITIAISTQCKSIPTDYTVYDIDTRPLRNLHSIYQKYTSKNRIAFSDMEFKRFSANISNNVYALTLFGKAINKCPDKFNKDDLMNSFSSYYLKNNMPKMHHAYKEKSKTEQQLFTLLYRLVSDYASINNLKDSNSNTHFSFLLELSIWAIAPLSEYLLRHRFGNEKINTAISFGILQYYDAAKLYMPQLLADAIWNYYNPTIPSNYTITITNFLNALSIDEEFQITYEDLYKIVFNLISRFYYQVSILPSRPSKDQKNTLKNWNLHLTYFIEGYLQLGNFQYAMNALSYLYITQKKQDKNRVPSKVENPKLNDLQKSIRKLLELQSKYMSCSDKILDEQNRTRTDRSDTIDSFIDFFSELRTYFKTNKELDPILVYVLNYVIQDLAASAIRVSFHYITYCLENIRYPSINLIDNLCTVFEQCSQYFFCIRENYPNSISDATSMIHAN